MTAGDRAALEALNIRFDHTASIAVLVAQHTDVPPDLENALRGIAETLNELSERMDTLVHAAEPS
ncbi:hypothetical protein [Sphingomonas kyungheensis]|uniref:Histidine kinase n=1 Tax=Sphingomonas kyungheensis TaxID=1069987 RepID=A0ABU8H3X7_9SPHN